MKLSIILPCFNVANYLNDIFDCLINQSNGDWEAIFINDGSTDETLRKLELALKIDKRFHLINQVNQGVSGARNRGIESAKGEYIYFLDTDDLIKKDLVEKILDNVKQNPDVILFGFYEQLKNGEFREHKTLTMSRESLLKRYLTNRTKIHLCSCVFKRDFLTDNNLSFNIKTHYAEDREFIINALTKTKKIEFLPYRLYTYMYRDTSAMRIREYNLKRYSSVEACERIYKLLEFSSVKSEALIHLKTTIILHLHLLKTSQSSSEEASWMLKEKAMKYVSLPTPFVCYRDGLFCYVSSLLWRWPKVFDKFINAI